MMTSICCAAVIARISISSRSAPYRWKATELSSPLGAAQAAKIEPLRSRLRLHSSRSCSERGLRSTGKTAGSAYEAAAQRSITSRRVSQCSSPRASLSWFLATASKLELRRGGYMSGRTYPSSSPPMGLALLWGIPASAAFAWVLHLSPRPGRASPSGTWRNRVR